MRDDSLLSLAAYFAVLSLFTIGGGMAAVPEFQRLVVESKGWMTAQQFNDLFAIAQVSPGPNILLVTLIGYYVAGLGGAAATTLAMCGPTCLAAYMVGRTWDRFRTARWRLILEAGLVPIALGLLASSALVIAGGAAHNLIAIAVMLATAVLASATRVNPLWIFAIGGGLGFAGLI